MECGEPLRAARRDKRFCSDRCRYSRWDRLNPRLPLPPGKQPAQRLTDREREEFAKDRGMKQASERNAEWLERFRAAASEIARRGDGTAHIDQVRDWFDRQQIDYPVGPWIGSTFERGKWDRIGFTQSLHRAGRCRIISVWRLIG